MRIIISPYSQQLPSGRENPKNYPYWQELVDLLRTQGVEVIQLGRTGEPPFKGTVCVFDQNLRDVLSLVKVAEAWISVDNFLPHMCNAEKISTKGFVIFSKSDPRIYGYRQFTNILKSHKYLRLDQHGTWEECPFDPEAFFSAEKIFDILDSKIKLLKR